jgi:hypothetical protein
MADSLTHFISTPVQISSASPLSFWFIDEIKDAELKNGTTLFSQTLSSIVKINHLLGGVLKFKTIL